MKVRNGHEKTKVIMIQFYYKCDEIVMNISKQTQHSFLETFFSPAGMILIK